VVRITDEDTAEVRSGDQADHHGGSASSVAVVRIGDLLGAPSPVGVTEGATAKPVRRATYRRRSNGALEVLASPKAARVHPKSADRLQSSGARRPGYGADDRCA